MSQNLILLPILAQMLLTLLILGLLPIARGRSMRERRQQMQDMALAGKSDWNEQAQKTSNSFASQFELPVLFYAVCAFALITRTVDAAMLWLAVAFVATRFAHAAIHIGPNIVAWRFAAFALGLVALIAMIVRLAVAVIGAGF